MTNTYSVNGDGFESYFKAIEHARAVGADVVETSTGRTRWRPAAAAKKAVRHVLVNADGTETAFSKVRR